MARKTKRTLRRYSPLARELLKVANELHQANAKLIRIAERVAEKEGDSAALQRFMVSVREGAVDDAG